MIGYSDDKGEKLFNSNLRKLAVFLSLFQLPGIAVTQTAEQAAHIPVSRVWQLSGVGKDSRPTGAGGRHW